MIASAGKLHSSHSRYWSIKWYGGRGRFDNQGLAAASTVPPVVCSLPWWYKYLRYPLWVDLVSGRIISGHRTVDARLAFRKRFLHIDGRTRLPKMARTRRALSIHGQRRILRASRSHSPAISHSARMSLPLLEILLQSHDHAFFSRLASQKVRASSPTAQNAPRNHGKPYAPYPPATRLS